MAEEKDIDSLTLKPSDRYDRGWLTPEIEEVWNELDLDEDDDEGWLFEIGAI